MVSFSYIQSNYLFLKHFIGKARKIIFIGSLEKRVKTIFSFANGEEGTLSLSKLTKVQS